MALTIAADPIPLRMDDDATVRVGQTRVTLDTVISTFRRGATPEEIAESFPTLKLADVYAVISYYLRHREEVDAYLRQREEEAAATRREIESRPGYGEFRERLLAHRERSRKSRG